MPFDGVQYGRLPLLRRSGYYPGERASADIMRRVLAAGYSFARNGSNLIGYFTWGDDPRIPTTRLTNKATTNVTVIASPGCRLPPWATRVVAHLTYYLAEDAENQVAMRVTVASDPSGPLVTQAHVPIGPARVTREHSEFVAVTYGVIRAFGEIATTPTDLPTTITVTAGASNRTNDTVAEPMRPHILALYWEAVG